MEHSIIRTEYSELMQKSYIDYAMSVIIARALPDVRDGLKPVQRRTLYDMYELGIRYDKPYRKSARIVGDTMGKYHPHGDSSIYDALVVMAQDFKKGLPLVDGHGNFGSIEGDGAAAMRYTEARLQKVTQEAYLADLDKNVVDFMPNFDETEKEPVVLPVKVPNLLVNGAEGIAVGMATSIPPHNFGEVIDGVIAYMKNPDITTAEMMQYIPGPDFPTGGIIANKDDLPAIYESGVGKIKIRGKIEIEKGKGGKDRMVITEIPYTMIGANIGKFLNDVYGLVESKATSDITDITNQSSKEGIRIVLELKKGADIEALENLLYKKTKLEDTFGVNMLAVADGRPETMGVVPIIRHHVKFQYEIATRKYQTLLAKEQDKKEIQEGLIKACDVIDLIIEILRGSKNVKDARACLTDGVTDNITFLDSKNMYYAGKSGTSQLNTDKWFIGFSPYYTAGVWIGNDDSTPVNTNYYTMPQLNIWKDIMEHAHEGLEYTEFQKPYNIVEAEVCASSGKLAIPGLCDSDPRGSQVIKEYFEDGTVPTEVCDVHIQVTMCKDSNKIATDSCPPESRFKAVYIKKDLSLIPNIDQYIVTDLGYVITPDKLNDECDIHSH